MLSRSIAEMTAFSGTLVNSAILRRSPSGNGCSLRHSSTSGWMPMLRSSFTECWVGLVLSSPAAAMYGIRVRCMYIALSGPRSMRICRIASRNGSDSMSPTVPPISTSATSKPAVAASMQRLISSVTCGMTCTVPPR